MHIHMSISVLFSHPCLIWGNRNWRDCDTTSHSIMVSHFTQGATCWFCILLHIIWIKGNGFISLTLKLILKLSIRVIIWIFWYHDYLGYCWFSESIEEMLLIKNKKKWTKRSLVKYIRAIQMFLYVICIYVSISHFKKGSELLRM